MDCFLGENVWESKHALHMCQKESRVWINDLSTSFDLKHSWCRTTAISDKFLQRLCVLQPVHSNTRKDRSFGPLHSNAEYRMPNGGLKALWNWSFDVQQNKPGSLLLWKIPGCYYLKTQKVGRFKPSKVEVYPNWWVSHQILNNGEWILKQRNDWRRISTHKELNFVFQRRINS